MPATAYIEADDLDRRRGRHAVGPDSGPHRDEARPCPRRLTRREQREGGILELATLLRLTELARQMRRHVRRHAGVAIGLEEGLRSHPRILGGRFGSHLDDFDVFWTGHGGKVDNRRTWNKV